MSTLYLDMDGVVADFNSGLRGRGVVNDQDFIHLPKEQWTPSQIDLDRQVREVMDDMQFWAEIPPFPFVQHFYDSVLRLSPYKVKFLTAAPNNFVKREQLSVVKRVWLWRHLKVHPADVIVCLRSEKQRFAKSNADVLVDDSRANCEEFAAAGGRSVFHESFLPTLQELRKIYER